MDFRSSAGTPKTIHLAVDWHHNESPFGGRSAVDCLLKSTRAPWRILVVTESGKEHLIAVAVDERFLGEVLKRCPQLEKRPFGLAVPLAPRAWT